jgi:uncharacterized protein
MLFDVAVVHSPAAAFCAGLVTSLHCAAMCGPICCSLLFHNRATAVPSKVGGRALALHSEVRPGAIARDVGTIATVYHLCRLTGYAVFGGIVAGLGKIPLLALPNSWVRLLPWVLVLVFIGIAFRLERFLPRPGWAGKHYLKYRSWTSERSALTRAALIGSATPLIPCGPMYLMLSLSIFAGSAVKGAEMMLAFGLGTTPLLWIAQTRLSRRLAQVSPMTLRRVQAGIALGSAVVISWRLRGTLGFGGASVSDLVCF